MNREFWLNRWMENRIGFHRTEVNRALTRFWPKLSDSPGRTLVPMCGKSVDLVWLAERGHEVVGVDISEIAARSFAAEQGTRTNVRFVVGDFFDLDPAKLGKFDLVYDRAALIALPAERRPAYVLQLERFLKPNGKMLLITLEYDPQQMSGPPFTVPEPEVRALLDGWSVEKFDEYDCLEDEPHFKSRGVTWMKESVYQVQHR
jgi:thiopurine S-methyltransferase